MSKINTRIESLINRAAHKSTPENEARSCALIAVKLIEENKLTFITKERLNELEEIEKAAIACTSGSWEDWYNKYKDDDIPPVPSDEEGTVINNFNLSVTKTIEICKKCNMEINKGEIAAKVHQKGFTHYKCRHFWVTSSQ